MRTNNTLGIIFANTHDAMLGELTMHRSMGSLPYGGRYRLIDFALSNLCNAGIGKVGIITKSNYHSLMTHIGSGKPWDLDRKNGGLSILPPYASGETQVYKGRMAALYNIMEYLHESEEENVILCDSDVIANINVKALLTAHKKNLADVTVVYAKGNKPAGQNDMMDFTFDQNGQVTAVNFGPAENCDFSLDVTVINRKLLMGLVESQIASGCVSFSHGVFENNFKNLKIFGFKHEGYYAIMDSVDSYVKANLDLINCNIREDVFNAKNPIYTKTRDDMPARYGINSNVKSSLIADGCIIEGTVKNSVLFRGVKVEKGATVENCVLMEGTTIESGSTVSGIITDRFVKVTQNKNLNGQAENKFIKKDAVI